MTQKRKLKETDLYTLFYLMFFSALAWSLYKYTRVTLLAIGAIVVIAFVLIFRGRKLRNRYLSDLKSLNEEVRINGVRSLLRIGADETIDDLADAFKREESTTVRKVIIEALCALSIQYRKFDESKPEPYGSPMTISGPSYETVLQKYVLPPLKKALRSENREEREAAIMALIWIGTKDAFKAIEESSIDVVPPELITQTQKDVQFTVFYPTVCNKTENNSIYIYAYINEMLKRVYKDVLNSKSEFDNSIPHSSTSTQTIRLRDKTPITIVPECGKIDFTPQSVTNRWNGEWVPFNFSFNIKERQNINDDELYIRISVRILSIEVSHIKFKIRLVDEFPIVRRQNPLALAKYSSDTFLPYQRIFVSYSRKDHKVVRVYRRVHQAVGNDVFMDTYSIGAGENWQAALANAIDTADIFQLFWSENSAKSTSVRDEWDYALNYRCPESKCVNFIRPVYWVTPIPAEPPEELKHLNFKYVTFDTT